MRLERHNFDAEYIRRLVSGDPETEHHFTRYFGELLVLKLRSRLRSPAQVEDARQETFVRVLATLKQKGGLASAESLGAFVNGVCNNVLFEMYRANARTTARTPPSSAPPKRWPGTRRPGSPRTPGSPHLPEPTQVAAPGDKHTVSPRSVRATRVEETHHVRNP